MGRLVHRKVSLPEDERDRQTSSVVPAHIIGSIFSLLAFMVGLTFSIAVARFDDRRDWVAEEATAIEVAFNRADLLAEPDRSRLRDTLREYARSRIAPDGVLVQTTDKDLHRAHQLRTHLWDSARNLIGGGQQSGFEDQTIEGVNQVITVGTRRELAGTTHIPSRIVNALIMFLLVASGVLGFLSGSGTRRHHAAAALLFVLFAIAFVIILDLDRPRSGAIKVSQEPIEDLVSRLDRAQSADELTTSQ